MNSYVTFCDFYYSNFLYINLKSLSYHLKNKATFIIYCLDKKLFDEVKKWKFRNIKIILLRIEDIKDKRINLMKSNRLYKYFCWGLSPFVIKDSLIRLNKEITYLDTDLVFNNDPDIYFYKRKREIKNRILLTPHFYENEALNSARHGKFCIQFMTFPNIKSTFYILEEWASNCFIDSGINLERNVFGDQLYLDKWPKKYKNHVYIEKNKSSFIGPWNTNSFSSKQTIAIHLHSSIFFKLFNFLIFIACSSGYKLSIKHKKFIKNELKKFLPFSTKIYLNITFIKKLIRSIFVSMLLRNPILIKFLK